MTMVLLYENAICYTFLCYFVKANNAFFAGNGTIRN